MIREGSFGPAEAVILLAISNIARFFFTVSQKSC
jgi:hypothetical protein